MTNPPSKLDLPYILASQADKHVTFNQAMDVLNQHVQNGVASKTTMSPPLNPNPGIRYLVPVASAGAWLGKAHNIAVWRDDAWDFYPTWDDYCLWIGDEAHLAVRVGSSWTAITNKDLVALKASRFGINGEASEAERLVVQSDSILLSHDLARPGSGNMHLKLNKSAAAKSASILFQSNYDGKAELGLLGNNNFAIKIPIGAGWDTPMLINTATGQITLNAGNVRPALLNYGPLFQEDQVTQNPYIRLNDGANPGYIELAGGDMRLSAKGPNMDIVFFAGNNERMRCKANAGAISGETQFLGNCIPGIDNGFDLGTSSRRWNDVWATNATIQTSDSRNKRAVRNLKLGLAFINDLRPVQFKWKDRPLDDFDIHQPPTPVYRQVVQVKSETREETVFEDGRYVRKPHQILVSIPLTKSQPIVDEAGLVIGAQELPVMELVPQAKPHFVDTHRHVRAHFGLVAQDVTAALKRAGVNENQSALVCVGDGGEHGLRYGEIIPILILAIQELAKAVQVDT